MTSLFTLASASETRARLLRAAGLSFDVRPARIDERAVEAEGRAAGEAPAAIACRLAVAKGRAVLTEMGGTVPVVAADQVLEVDGAIEHKPASRAAAAEQLARLAGAVHFLHTAAVIIRADGEQVWERVATARMAMRPLSPDEIEAYLDTVGDLALTSVGGYQIEGPGIQLFDDVHGDYFGILGLPLLPLLKALRNAGILT